MKNKILRLGTRRSPLALLQTGFVKKMLLQKWPSLEVETVEVITTGDRIRDRPISEIGGKNIFLKEIEEKLISGEIDAAVHSLKDVPAILPDGLKLLAFPEREDPRDAFVSGDPVRIPSLVRMPKGAGLATGSMRRGSQIRAFRDDLEIIPVRGNVDTRLKKLDKGEFDAIILASAALIRLNLSSGITEKISPDICLPAAGQGALAVEGRANDSWIAKLLAAINHQDTQDCVEAERAFLRRLDGGCQVPMAAYAILEGEGIFLRGMIGSIDGAEIVSGEKRAERNMAEQSGIELAEELLGRGGDKIIAGYCS